MPDHQHRTCRSEHRFSGLTFLRSSIIEALLTWWSPPGMPDPATIAKQKDSYMKMLDEQIKQGTQVLEAQVKHQKEYLVGQADQQKKQFLMQIDMEVGKIFVPGGRLVVGVVLAERQGGRRKGTSTSCGRCSAREPRRNCARDLKPTVRGSHGGTVKQKQESFSCSSSCTSKCRTSRCTRNCRSTRNCFSRNCSCCCTRNYFLLNLLLLPMFF